METNEAQLRQYFAERKALKIRALEEEAGIGRGGVDKWLRGDLTKGSIATLSQANQSKLVNLLTKKYGLVLVS
jgi:hypothetical protein